MGTRAVCVAVVCALALLLVARAPSDAAGPQPVPLTSPAPGSPVFVSFKSAYDGSFTTNFTIQATGSDLAYVWSLQNVTCGSLVAPQARGNTNGYAHESCATPVELAVRVTVLVARASDLDANGAPKSDDVPRFIYSQTARAQDSADTASVPPAPQLQYFGPAAPVPTTTSRATQTTGAVATTTDAGFPWWILPLIALAAVAAFFGWQRTTKKKPCDEEKERVDEAKAALDAAKARQRRINELRAANDKAQTDLAKAQAEYSSATNDRNSSWVEDAATGRRVYAKTDQARIDKAQSALTTAQNAAAAAKSAYEGAGNGNEITQAQYAVEDATRALQRAEEALARCLEINAPPPPAPAPPAPASPPPPPPPPPPPTPTTSTTSTTPPPPPPPPTVSRPTAVVHHECEDGDEPKVEVSSRDFELYLIWAGQFDVDGAFQFSEKDVDDALQGYKNFKTIADIANFVGGFAGAGGTAAVGEGLDIGSVLNIFTTGADRVSDYLDQPSWQDPSGAAGWGVEKALDRLIERVNRLRQLGTWSLTCPLVKVHATCTRTYECAGNHWVLTKHEFTLEYGEKIRSVSAPRPFDNVDHDDPARGAREARMRLTRYFEMRNKPVMDQIKAMVRACAAK